MSPHLGCWSWPRAHDSGRITWGPAGRDVVRTRMSRWVGRHCCPFETGIKSASISHSQVAGFGMKTWRHAPGHLLGWVRNPTVTIASGALTLAHIIIASVVHATPTCLRTLNTTFCKLWMPILIVVVLWSTVLIRLSWGNYWFFWNRVVW